MHVPDGFLDLPTSVATGVAATAALTVSLRRADSEIRESGPALAGLTAAFVFAVQMVNFPVGAGTSGHLLGGALAAALVGPWTGAICITAVLIVQGLLFADGGLTALGTNITLMGVTTVVVGYLVTVGMLRLLPRRPGSAVPAGAIGALLSVPAAALVFTALYAVGGTVPIPLPTLAATMLGWHVLIGIGEAVITAAVLGAVVASRPDLVYVARHLRPQLVLIDEHGAATTVSPQQEPSVQPRRRALTTALLTTLAIAGGLSLTASARPDGLEFVATSLGFGASGTTSAAGASPLADYSVAGVGNSAFASGLAGVIGVLVTLLLGLTIALLARRRRARRSPALLAAASGAGPGQVGAGSR